MSRLNWIRLGRQYWLKTKISRWYFLLIYFRVRRMSFDRLLSWCNLTARREAIWQRIFRNQPWVIHLAPAHKARINQDWCRAELPEFICAEEWRPFSPDLNPLDYSICEILRRRSMRNSTEYWIHWGEPFVGNGKS